MSMVESRVPYVLTGCVFSLFGIKWVFEYAKYWVSSPRLRDDQGTTKTRFTEKCERFLANHPIEGSLKLIATAVGLGGTLLGGLPDIGIVSPRVMLATICLFFAFSGLVDVLHFYFPHNISDGLVKMALAQSFFVEGFLFMWANTGESAIVNLILAAIAWTTSFAIALELVWPEAKFLRGSSTMIHGGWIGQMVCLYRKEAILPAKVALAFSWHIASVSVLSLIVVTITRCQAPKLVIEPPEIPAYDYVHEPDHRI